MIDKNVIAKENLGLVHACCKHFANKGFEYEELYSAGSLGLAKAIDRFDETRGLKFSTYAFPVIMGEIKRLFRDGGTVKVSRSLKELSMKISKTNRVYKQKYNREMTVKELSKELDVTPEKIIDALNSVKYPLSLTSDYDDDGNPQLDIPTQNLEESISDRLSIRQAISQLNEKEQKIIKLRYFLNKTQCQTAKVLNMTQVQVSRQEKKILLKMRNIL